MDRSAGQRLLVIDDEELFCRPLQAVLTRLGFDVITAHDGHSGLDRVATHRPDMIILDMRLPGMNGLDVLHRVRATHPGLPVLMVSGSAEAGEVMRAAKLGAVDYLVKPVDADQITFAVRRALAPRKAQPAASLTARMGTSAVISKVIEQVALVAPSPFTVLISGETGTGKDLVAQAIHDQSNRAHQPFVAVDCSTIPEALFESELFGHEKGSFTGAVSRQEGRLLVAEGGTFFLDEVGNLPLVQQAKILRVLETRAVPPVGAARATPVDVRFVAATNVDLWERVCSERFRADLYFRLAQYTIGLPRLRDRVEDIPQLAMRFLGEVTHELGLAAQTISREALARLMGQPWPGNVRELRNVVRQGALRARTPVVGVEELFGDARYPDVVASGSSEPAARSLKAVAEDAAREAEHDVICRTLRATMGNKTKAARLLQTDYKTLHVKMKLYGIRARDFSH